MSGVRRVYIANRGEIALRVIEACERLGYETVLGVSSVDRETLAAKRASRVLVVGGPRSTDSYLNREAVLHAALSTGCHAVHPGYGFLAESGDFARACAENGLIFIGPKPEQLETLGDKLSARAFAESVGVPVSPGGQTSTLEEATALAEKTGFPLLVKAAYGGGGRGMKLVTRMEELPEAWRVASSEAASAFGDGTVFLERFVSAAKHIEVQILGDAHGACVHLGERECSVQFRYQKMLEEAPSTALHPEDRVKLFDYAIKIGRGLGYRGLGTVEFLYNVGTREISFLEVNPRVQVEHPVTEAVTGVDLVREQILVAFGGTLPFTQNDISIEGHAVELRLTAQDPEHGLRPTPGRLKRWRPTPIGGVRWETHMYEGYLFPPYYDALMAKIIAWGPSREDALRQARRAVDELEVEGPTTNRALLSKLLMLSAVTENSVTTRWLEDQFNERKLP
ncbi:MAG: ATP-grasp domain-containing protein [Proteobacteria bacterium]|nr:ATP-grasp domain-containing protein [Pseudomonadota bacterium]